LNRVLLVAFPPAAVALYPTLTAERWSQPAAAVMAPNASVFGSGNERIRDMAHTGRANLRGKAVGSPVQDNRTVENSRLAHRDVSSVSCRGMPGTFPAENSGSR